MALLELKIEKSTNLKTKPDQSSLGFGVHFTDHMLVIDYDKAAGGWCDAKIMPYSNISLDPAAMVFHYSQEIFEGMKAYRADDGKVFLFRPLDNFARLNSSASRLCMPEIDGEFLLSCLMELLKIDIDWVPSAPGTSLYIRPFIIATDAHVGVRSSHTYKLIVILSPVGAYYPEGINPVKIMVEDEDVRAVKGGTGTAKAGGNYSATIRAQEKARRLGYTQVLWLDGVERRYVDEVGTMNIFFKIGGKVYTPPLDGSILPGITRDSSIKLMKSWGLEVVEEKIEIDFVFQAAKDGTLEEAFGTGTAAVISPVGELYKAGQSIVINQSQIGGLSQKLYDTLTAVQWGKADDGFGWRVLVN